MAARAIWKAVLRCAGCQVPVKLYSAIENQDLHFRILSRKDRQPVRQAMVNAQSGEIVPHAEIRRAYVAENGDRTILEMSELAALEPEASRDIEVISFLPPGQVDHRWYDRPYYLGPDGHAAVYSAFTKALEGSGLEGFARWVMRGREYHGSLRLHLGYPILISLRHANEVVAADTLEAPGGAALHPKELDMARQLIGMLTGELDLFTYRDEYRKRVLNFIDEKAKSGRALRLVRPTRQKPSNDVAQALKASLQAARRSA